MKRSAYVICLLLILVSSAGCAVSSPLKEIDAPAKTAIDVTATPDVAATPILTPSAVTPVVTVTPEITPSPTPAVFDVDNVDMQPTPGSSCFSEIGYDPDWEILVVRFRDSGSVYIYLDFPIDEWNEFISASSLGSWYNKHIKGVYECEKIS